MKIRKVLIANRGEIALRIIRACRDLGIESVQVYSKADEGSLPVKMADHAVCIGGAAAKESYLNTDALLSAAAMTGADAIHPGYGFLSENPEFAEACTNAGLVYVGPDAGIIRLMGNKSAARATAAAAGVSVIPGSSEPVSDPDLAMKIAAEVGYPVLVKASAGGGGRGMRVVANESQLRESLQRASTEAQTAFGSGEVYIEKYLPSVRHVEVQVFGDGTRAIHFGERDCTIQRRHQKLLEEAPSPAILPHVRESMLAAACALCEHVGYKNAGTVEFVLDAAAQKYYFIEMNTRIQVEHPVSELLTGYDLVRLQLQIAAGLPMSIQQSDIQFNGHVIECRINAEDPEKGFMPAPGSLKEFWPPQGPGVRVDTHVHTGYGLPPYYDSLVAKVLTYGQTREEAIAQMRRALHEMQIDGLRTTKEFHQRLMNEPDFLKGDFDTQFVKTKMWAGHPTQHLL